MYEPRIAEPKTKHGNNDVNFESILSIVFIDEVVDVSSGETDIDSLSDDDICNEILFLDLHLDP